MGARARAAVVSMVSVVAAACGGAGVGGGDPEQALPVELLGVECDSPNLDYAHVGYFVDHMTHWVELRPDGRRFIGSPIDEQTMELVTVSAAPIGDDRSPSGEFADTEFYVVSSIYDEMRAAVGAGVSFYAVVGPAPEWMEGADELLVVFAVDDAGHVGAPGYCQQIALMGPLERFAGGEAEVIELIGMPLERLQEVFAPPEPEPPPGPGEAALNPSSADPALLESLTLTGIQIHFPADWRGPFTLCSRIAEGWNDCLPLDGTFESPIGLSAYVGDSGIVEMWILGEHPDARSPVAMIGSVEIPREIIDARVVAIEVSGDLDPTTGELSGGAARLIDRAP